MENDFGLRDTTVHPTTRKLASKLLARRENYDLMKVALPTARFSTGKMKSLHCYFAGICFSSWPSDSSFPSLSDEAVREVILIFDFHTFSRETCSRPKSWPRVAMFDEAQPR